MINPFDYLFYKIYKTWRCLGERNSSSFYNSVGPMCILLIFNCFVIERIITGGINGLFVFYLPLVIPLTYLLPGRMVRVIKKYRAESEKSRNRGNLIVWCYVILTIVSLILVFKYR
jgi:hypothetical protein